MFIRDRKLNISTVFIRKSYFKVLKDVRRNSTHFLVMKTTPKSHESHSSETDVKDIMKIFKKYTVEPYSILVNHITLPSDNPLRFRKNLFKVNIP